MAEHLIGKQLKIEAEIKKILSNLKENTTQSPIYLQNELRSLDQLWTRFEDNDKLIGEIDTNHENQYSSTHFFDQKQKIYESTRFAITNLQREPDEKNETEFKEDNRSSRSSSKMEHEKRYKLHSQVFLVKKYTTNFLTTQQNKFLCQRKINGNTLLQAFLVKKYTTNFLTVQISLSKTIQQTTLQTYFFKEVKSGYNKNTKDLQILTPGHFTIGSLILMPPEPCLVLEKPNRFQRWRLTQKMVQDFWNAWSSELFGVLDERDAAHYDEQIDKLKHNEAHLLELIKNQTSIADSTINVLKLNREVVQKQFSQLLEHLELMDSTINNISKETERQNMKLAFLTIAMHTILVMNGYQQAQGLLLDIIMQTHHGKIHPLLLTPEQLSTEISNIRRHLPRSVMIPGDTNREGLLQIYNLMTAKARLTPGKLIICIKLPLPTAETFQIFQLHAVPTKHELQLIFIQPSTDYLIVSLHRDHFYPISENELRQCTRINKEECICRSQHPVYNLKSNQSQCEINLLQHDKQIISSCNLRTTHQSNVWIKLHEPNSWIYVMINSTTFDIICDSHVQPIKLIGDGIIKIQADCQLKYSDMVITAENTYTSRKNSSFLPSLQLSQHLVNLRNFTKLSPPLLNANSDMDLENLQKSIKQLKENEKLPENINNHDVHHYTVSYITLTILVIVIAFIITLKLKAWKKKSTIQIIQPPVPQPRMQNS